MRDAIDIFVSVGLFAIEWVFFAVDRPRALARRPEREGRVDAAGIWALRALVFGPLALPFYLGRTRGWRGTVAGIVLVAVTMGGLELLSAP